ncbi:MAG: glutathione S-transferase [Paracoccaceae bacterium]|jgi:glutathione S-transferase|nr:glutathione S-transferase [Paracoccaceae bacterium]
MTYRLYIMDRAYSSWSLRGHLLLDAFDLPFTVTHAEWPSPEFDALKSEIAPGRTVPALKIGDDLAWDSLAMAETLAELHPELSYWPKDSAARASARSLAAEMHSGFSALRSDCPMNLRRRYDGFQASEAVLADVARVEELWGWARSRYGDGGPFLFGEYGAVDAFFTPLASRLDTYGLPQSDMAAAYVDALHRVPAFRRWRAMACAAPRENPAYEFDLPRRDGFGPGATPLAAAVSDGPALNDACPYSGKPVDAGSIAEIDGLKIGYCNPFCRDKSVADVEAWPASVQLMADLRS